MQHAGRDHGGRAHGHALDHGHGSGQGTGHASAGDFADAVDDDFVDDFDDDRDPTEKVDEIRLTTVGIDIGSATTHFLLSLIVLRRLGAALMSRYEIVEKRELFRSEILLTPYRSSSEIDADGLSAFFDDSFARSGFAHDDIDTGIVMLTGEAARKANARAIATLFAGSMGKFVCTSAGHHLEARMAAHGSGAAAASVGRSAPMLNVDIGGGTTKFTLLENGRILGTAALNVGGRLIAIDDDGLVRRIDEAASLAAAQEGVEVVLGKPLSEFAQEALADVLASCIVDYLTTAPPYSGLTKRLLLTPPVGDLSQIRDLMISGGVSEYLVTPETVSRDLGRALAHRFVTRAKQAGLNVQPALERMRATVVGLSQFTTQLSGDTVYVSAPGAVPLLNLAVVPMEIADTGREPPVSAEIAEEVHRALVAAGRDGLLDPIALRLGWRGRPYYQTLRAIADGIAQGAKDHLPDGPLVVVLGQDCAKSLGALIHDAVGDSRDVVCVDGLQLTEHDFIDVGGLIQNDSVLPVVVKTLVFPDVGQRPDPADAGSALRYVEVGGQIL